MISRYATSQRHDAMRSGLEKSKGVAPFLHTADFCQGSTEGLRQAYQLRSIYLRSVR